MDFLGVKSTETEQFEKFITRLEYFHPTSLLFTHAFGNPNNVFYNKNVILEANRMLGYDFYVSDCSLNKNQITVTINNKGTAPFYYDWPVKIALYDGNKIVYTENTDWKISKIASKSSQDFVHSFNFIFESGKTYSVLIAIPNPMENGYPISFSNKTQDSVLTGWLTLGTIKK